MNLLRVIIGAYGLNLTIFLALSGLIGESWSLIAFFNSLLHLLLIPAVALLPICLLLRRWGIALLMLPGVVVFLLSYGPFFLPRSTAAPPDSARISLLSYNLHRSNTNSETVLTIIREADADVVALQELNPTIAESLERALAERYPYMALHADTGYTGQGVLSRYPITDDEYWTMSLGNQRVVIGFSPSASFTLYNIHPAHPFTGQGLDFRRRRDEIDDILRQADQENGPLLLVGDFNMTDQSEDYRRITARYQDTYREAGWGMGFTFPTYRGFQLPLARLDYIFHTAHFQGMEARVWPISGGSDHRPLWGRLALVQGAEP